MTLVLVDNQDESRARVEHDARPGPDSRADDQNYWRMFVSSVQAAVITVLGQFGFTLYLALQWGLRVELRLWKGFLPFLAINANRGQYDDAIRLSSIFTALVLAAFCTMAMFRGRRLQVQAGRAFGWIDVALIGMLNLSRAWWFDNALQPQRWMYVLVLLGIVGFAVSAMLVWIDFDDRAEGDTKDAGQATTVQADEPTTLSAA